MALIDRIPISVMAKHATHELRGSDETPQFGMLINRVLWTEFDPDLDNKRLKRDHTWRDKKERFIVEAQIFDVGSLNAVLRKKDGQLIRVDIENLHSNSAVHLRVYQRMRQRMLSRLPAKPDRRFAKTDDKKPATPERLSGIIDAPKNGWWKHSAAILAFKSIDGILEDVSSLMKSAGFSNFVPMITLGAGAFLEGVDTEKPFGAFLMYIGEEPVVVFCLPVTDLDDVIDTLENNGVEIEEDGKDFIFISPTGDEFSITSKGGWAYASNSEIDFDKFPLPKDPAAIFRPLAEQHTIALSTRIQNFPESIQQEVVNVLRAGPAASLKSLGDSYLNSLAQDSFEIGDLAINNAQRMSRQVKEIAMGWRIWEEKEKRTFLDFDLGALEGTPLARTMAAANSSKSSFQGFAREKSALAIHGVADLLEEDKEQLVGLIAKYQRQFDNTSLEGKIATQLLLVLDSVVKSKKLDLAGSVRLKNKTVDFVLGFQVSKGPEIDELINDLMTTIEKGYDKEKIKVELNAANYQGINFHKVAISIPKHQRTALKIFGVWAEFYIGVGKGAIYVGTGPHAFQSIKDCIDASLKEDSKVLKGMQLKLELQPIFEFFHKLDEDRSRQGLWKRMSSTLDEHSSIVISLLTKRTAQTLRVEFRDNVLRLVQIIVAEFTGGGFGSDF